jgi:hypothetical protein
MRSIGNRRDGGDCSRYGCISALLFGLHIHRWNLKLWLAIEGVADSSKFPRSIRTPAFVDTMITRTSPRNGGRTGFREPPDA